VLPVSNTEASAIAVDDSASQGATSETIDTVQIKDVGTFSRKQIETFKHVQHLKTACDLNLDMHKWLHDEGIPSLPAHYHGLAKDVAADILDSYPYKELSNLSLLPDYTYQMLYRATPPTWLTDAALSACCERLVSDYGECRFAGCATASTVSKRTRSKGGTAVDDQTRDKILNQAREVGVDAIFLPVNFMNAHWCCVVVKVQAKRIFFYDPLNQAPYKNACMQIATHLKVSGLQDFDVVAQNNPIQFDSFSCGVYVCWMFIRHAVHGLRVDMAGTSLPRRRFELFYYLKEGRLLTAEPATAATPSEIEDEAKPPPPSQSQDEEQHTTTKNQLAASQDQLPDTQEQLPATQEHSSRPVAAPRIVVAPFISLTA
jgi:hypothetical protein